MHLYLQVEIILFFPVLYCSTKIISALNFEKKKTVFLYGNPT
jgi:hypothetical protein